MAGLPRTLPEIIRKAIAGSLQDVHVALPGTVVKWDATTNLADVQVAVQHPVWDDDNGRTYEDIGVLLGVPVQWPRAGGYLMTLPMAAGDSGLLVFCSTPIGEWRSTGQTSKPVDASRHSIGWPVFIPGVFADVKLLSPTDLAVRTAGMVIGKDGSPQQIRINGTAVELGANAVIPVGLATPTTAALSALQTEIAAVAAALVAVCNIAPLLPAHATAAAAATTAVGVAAALVTAQSALLPATLVKAI